MRLITIPMSHYCEKARWGLSHAGLDYVEEPHLQVFHYLAVRRYDCQGMVPVLLTDDGAVADSTAILQYLDRRLPEGLKLYPARHRDEIEALEEAFDEGLGIESRRWVYFNWQTESARQVLKIAAQGTPRWERALAPALFPMMRRYLDRHLALSADNVARGLRQIEAAFDTVAARLADGRPYLFGERINAADITFAALAAPMLLPDEYGIRLPTPETAPPAARPQVAAFRAHPAGEYVLRLFREDRHRAASP